MSDKYALPLFIIIVTFPLTASLVGAFLSSARAQNNNPTDTIHSRYSQQVLAIHQSIVEEQSAIQIDLKTPDWNSAKTRILKLEAQAVRYAMALHGFVLLEELAQEKSIEAVRNIVEYLDANHEQSELPEWQRLFGVMQKLIGDPRIKEHGDLVMWWLSKGYEGKIEEADGQLKWVKKEENK